MTVKSLIEKLEAEQSKHVELVPMAFELKLILLEFLTTTKRTTVEESHLQHLKEKVLKDRVYFAIRNLLNKLYCEHTPQIIENGRGHSAVN